MAKISFGKYKGRDLQYIPHSYIHWLTCQIQSGRFYTPIGLDMKKAICDQYERNYESRKNSRRNYDNDDWEE